MPQHIPNPPVSGRQIEILTLLDEHGSLTVREAMNLMEDDLSYTGVLTIFQTLDDNGIIRHSQEGKAYRYHPKYPLRIVAGEYSRWLLDRSEAFAGVILADLEADLKNGSD